MGRLTKWFKNVRLACIARTQLHGQILFEAYNLEDDDATDIQHALDKLAEYEDAEEQGLMVRLPCKVDGSVYTLTTIPDELPIIEFRVCSAYISNDGPNEYHAFGETEGWAADEFYFRVDDIGKTVFLTREAAEAALAAQKGGEGA